jgi:hypothetical protein
VTDGLVMSTGAVLGTELDEVVARTRDAVELVRLPELEDPIVRGLAERSPPAGAGNGHAAAAASMLVGEDRQPVELAPRFVLTSEAEEIAAALEAAAPARWLIVHGALPETFMRNLLRARRGQDGGLVLVVADSTRAFLSDRGPEWYRLQGLEIQTLDTIDLEAITVNPVAPQSHSFDSTTLREALAEAVADVRIFDVMHPDYLSLERSAPSL